jgi:hypothetical protein
MGSIYCSVTQLCADLQSQSARMWLTQTIPRGCNVEASYRVTAPSDADETSLAYLAITPVL